jgi:D-serine deaminase-like pyridoxal phosphate-dependent protein
MTWSISRRSFLQAATTGSLVAAVRPSGVAEAAILVDAILLDEPIPINDVPTPALLLDRAVFESNLKKMADHVAREGLAVRPHSKTHKCPVIAKRQLELGAVGICCAKVSEAQVMADAGISDILITSPVVTMEKILPVISMAKNHAGILMVIDNVPTAERFDAAAKSAGTTVNVLIDLDTGTRRTGIAPGARAVELAEYIVNKCPSLSLAGIQSYAGHLMHIPGHSKRKERSLETMKLALETKKTIESKKIPIAIFSGGGTGTFDIDSGIEGVTELQVGSYPFMDVQYRAIGDADGDVFDYFTPSLFVLVTAISQPVEGLITVDAGYKSFAAEDVKPEFADIDGLVYNWGGDEHGIVQLQNPSLPFELGDKTRLIVSHCDPTVNLYDFYHVVDDGHVTELWPVSARGKSQ